MAVEVTSMPRRFLFNGTKYPDPNPHSSPEEVRDYYVPGCPELATAEIKGPMPNNGYLEYRFERAIGAKG